MPLGATAALSALPRGSRGVPDGLLVAGSPAELARSGAESPLRESDGRGTGVPALWRPPTTNEVAGVGLGARGGVGATDCGGVGAAAWVGAGTWVGAAAGVDDLGGVAIDDTDVGIVWRAGGTNVGVV